MKLSKFISGLLLGTAGSFVGRAQTHDVSFTYRMGIGFPGDLTRISGFKVEAIKVGSTPPEEYGMVGVLDASGDFRRITAADQSDVTPIPGYGVIVRPYPLQENTAAPLINTATPPTSGVIDVLRSGYILTHMPAAGTVKKGDPVYVWAAASTGAHVIGDVEAAASAGNTIKINNAFFNGPADVNNVVEIQFNI